MSQINRERVKLLVDALRSGEFEQGQGYLTLIFRNMPPSGELGGELHPRKHCCLGVGCIVAMKHGAEISTNEHDAVGWINYYDPTKFGQFDDSSDTHLPSKIRDWYGFTHTNPALRVTRAQAEALVADARMPESTFTAYYADPDSDDPVKKYVEFDATDCNDDFKMTFAEIADAFEYTYLTDYDTVTET